MKKLSLILLTICVVAFCATMASATPYLYESLLNVDGGITDVTESFPDDTGIGTISVTLSGIGAHYVGLFVDHELDRKGNTYFNETGATTGTAALGQSWEIDDPWYGFIYGDFEASYLWNENNITDPDDVAMALAWDFTLEIDETATIAFIVSEAIPTADFYLSQTDFETGETIYFSSTLTIGGGGPPSVPEPATMLLLGTGLIGLCVAGRKRIAK